MVKIVKPFTMHVCAGLLTLGALASCDEVEQDDFVFEGGNSPDPTAIFEGSVLYSGRAPQCVTRADGSVHVQGNAVLTLFEYGNPPPPEGTATSSLNLLVISGDDLFDVADCAAGGNLTRSVPFTWPRLPLIRGASRDYQVRGFYDYDADFIPFFSVTRLPTEGDIIGAALNNPSDASQGFLRISLPPLEEATKGIVKKGITVAVGNQVRSERPAFKLDENRRLNADAPFGPNFGGAGLRTFRSLTCATPGTEDCGLTLLRLGEVDKPQLAAAGIQLAVDDPATYAFTVEPVDIKKINVGPDEAIADGVPDPHPFLAGLGINLFTPMVILQRIQSSVEVQTKVPRVIMVGSVLLNEDTPPTAAKRTYVNGAPIAVAPVGAVELKANDAACRVPYFPPGTSSLVLDRRIGHCAELPTGKYAVNVLGGIAGGTVVDVDPAVSENGKVVNGGRYSGQSWTVPNELANPLQVGDANVLAHQGVQGAFEVRDPTPNVSGECTIGVLHPRCEGDTAGVQESAAPGIPNIDSATCLPKYCCDEIAHLWEVPGLALCPFDETTGMYTASSVIDHIAANGVGVPTCLPFPLPAVCAPPAP